MATWKPLPLDAKWFTNVQEAALGRNQAALENAFPNEVGGYTRFPGLADFTTLAGAAPTYLGDWQGDMVAASGGRVWRITADGTATEVTGVPVAGPGRVIFTHTADELVLSAGGPIVRLAGPTTELLSADAPDATHTAYIDGYLLAIETGTGLMKHSAANAFRDWDPIDVFAADSLPDNLTAALVTPYREVILAGPDSIEQFDRLSNASTVPFARRWAVGEGVLAPYTLTFADNGLWCLNERSEFVRASGQVSRPVSDDVGYSLESVDDITDAWASPILVRGQKYVLLQFPQATNPYGTRGLTLLFDYRQTRWASLYGWNAEQGGPDGWPGCSYFSCWKRHFVGGQGRIYELKADTYQNAGAVQRVLLRTGHYSQYGEVRIDNLRVRLKRGLADSNATPATVGVRVRRDAKTWTRWRHIDLGHYGETEPYVEFGGQGIGRTFQVEIAMTDAAELELVGLDAQLTPVGR